MKSKLKIHLQELISFSTFQLFLKSPSGCTMLNNTKATILNFLKALEDTIGSN